MRRRTFLALLTTPVIVSVVGSCGSDGGESGVDGNGFTFVKSSLGRRNVGPTDAPAGGRAVNLLGANLYGRIATVDAVNVAFSPASIMFALAMTSAGARGTTSLEMYDVLHADATGPAGLHAAMNSLISELDTRSGTLTVADEPVELMLEIGNSMWGQRGVEWGEEFLDLLSTEYGTGMRVVDYATNTEDARKAINGWVSDATNDRIPSLLDAGVLTPDSRLTLVNTVYMKAPWLNPFPPEATSDGEFTTVSGAKVTVPFMRMTEQIPYTSGEGWTAADLSYAGGTLSLLIVMPDEGELARIESEITTGLLDDVVAELQPTSVALSMPKFDVGTKTELSKVLAALGMPSAFAADTADFSGMTADEKLFVSFVVHQANITVDEKGTEAAAATASGMAGTSAPSRVVDMLINRPFLYAVRDIGTGALLFLGRVGDPSTS